MQKNHAIFHALPLDHIEICTPNRHQAAEWYNKVLGFEIVNELEYWAGNSMGPLMISHDDGKTMIALFECPSVKPERKGIKTIALRCSGKEFVAFLNVVDKHNLKDHKGAPVTPHDHGKAFSIYFCDPYGTPLEITTYEHDKVRNTLPKNI